MTNERSSRVRVRGRVQIKCLREESVSFFYMNLWEDEDRRRRVGFGLGGGGVYKTQKQCLFISVGCPNTFGGTHSKNLESSCQLILNIKHTNGLAGRRRTDRYRLPVPEGGTRTPTISTQISGGTFLGL